MKTPEPRKIITGVTVIDVEKGIGLPGQTVWISGSQIEKVEPQGVSAIPENVQRIDGHGLSVMPGLVDAHVHFFDAPIFGRLMLANGILLVRDMGMPNEYILNLRAELNRQNILGPEMVAVGAILDGNPPIIPLISIAVETPEAGRKVVQSQAEAGVDMIKAYSRLDREVFLAILDEAHRRGLKVAAHLPESIYLEEAAAAGLDCSEHFNGFEKVIAGLLGERINLQFRGQAADAGFFMRLGEVRPEMMQGVYRHMRQSGLTICPTVVTFKTMTKTRKLLSGSFPGSEYVSPAVMGMWRPLWDQQEDLPEFIWQNWLQMVVGLYQEGVPLMIGTDLMLPGILPGFSAHEEMALWQEAGIPPADILRSAITTPIRFMHLEKRLGSIAAGKDASMILVRGDPLLDVRSAARLEGVILQGRYFSRMDLDNMLVEARGLAKKE